MTPGFLYAGSGAPPPGQRHVLQLIETGPLPGVQRLPQADARATHDLWIGPAWQMFSQSTARVDRVQLDQIQGHDWCRALAKLCLPGTRLSATSLTEAQRHGLAAVGFAFDDAQHARFTSRKPVTPLAAPQRQAIVIGAGLAGCAVAERLCARGWQVDLIEQHDAPAQEASGNLAGIFRPILSKDDALSTRWTRAAFLFATRQWERMGRPFVGARSGVLHLARDPEVQREIAALWQFPSDYARWLEAPQASALLSHPLADGGWYFPQAGWARPASLCAAQLAACGAQLRPQFGTGRVTLVRADGQWRCLAPDGRMLAQAPNVVLASGAAALPWIEGLPMQRLRGQVSHVGPDHLPALPMVVCGEAYLTPLHEGVACVGASYDLDDDTALRQSSHDDNLARAGELLGLDLRGAPLAGRVGFRAVAPDRLPLLGSLPDAANTGRSERLREVARHPGLYAALGLASRGLTWAPLMAELLASKLEGEPLPLELALVDALDPARFLLRARRKGG